MIIERKPIKVIRTPIKLPTQLKMMIKMRELEVETRDDDIMIIARHYEMLVRDFKKLSGYSALYRDDPKRHKNWKHFECVYEACRLKGWNTKLYVESQFDRAKLWINGSKYPFPSQMYSVDAFRHFSNYLSSIIQKHEYDMNGGEKKKGKQTKSIKEHVTDEIVGTADTLSFYISNSNFEDKAQYKALRLYQSWQEFSPYYLWTIPWFHKILDNIGESQKSRELIETFSMIDKSPSVRNLIAEIVPQVDIHFNMPPNIEL